MKRWPYTETALLKKELKQSFLFFLKEANWKEESKGFGLIRDKTQIAKEVASIASCGFGLGAFVIGVKHHWISWEEGYYKARRMLETFLNTVEGQNGFFYHFINIETGKRVWNCEVSIIDTGIFICGALTAGEFFGGAVKTLAEQLYKKINWQWYTNPETNQFYMGYTPEEGFSGKWDGYAEQLMLYVLGVASPTFPISKTMYTQLPKARKDYGKQKDMIYTYCGTLFTYQFSHAWIDFKKIEDEEGIDWFENSIKATRANQEYCIDQQKRFKTFGENSWGLTACIGPKGYSGAYGAQPCKTNIEVENDGTVSPCGAIGSIVFTPRESLKCMTYWYRNFPRLWGKYGFKDAYNLEDIKPWYAKEYLGIDKGISVLMIENYLSGNIWRYCMQNKYIQEGLKNLGFHAKKNEESIRNT
ncbi:MAG: glucoamylase family protein [Clostridia bacterium]